VVKGFSQH
jgi:hypothetical protein